MRFCKSSVNCACCLKSLQTTFLISCTRSVAFIKCVCVCVCVRVSTVLFVSTVLL